MYLAHSSDYGATFQTESAPILTVNASGGQLGAFPGPPPPWRRGLRRSNSAPASDTFRSPVIMQLAADPIRTNTLYLVYADQSADGQDLANIYFTCSASGGTPGSWIPRIQVNSDTTLNDQWQPSVTIRPDGNKIFIAWYDRREDPANNSMIRVYGVIADLPVTGQASFAGNFRISTTSFPPVFTGVQLTPGTYDPAYPPYVECFSEGWVPGAFNGNYAPHMGDYDTAVSDMSNVFYSWSDHRHQSADTVVVRPQSDIRFARIPWSAQSPPP